MVGVAAPAPNEAARGAQRKESIEKSTSAPGQPNVSFGAFGEGLVVQVLAGCAPGGKATGGRFHASVQVQTPCGQALI